MSNMVLSERIWAGASGAGNEGVAISKPLLRPMILLVIGVIALTISAKLQILTMPVPVTLQVLVVMIIGAAYGARLGGATLASYLALGGVGAPVFAKGGGAIYFFGPTGGYLFGMLIAAILVGHLAQKGWDRSPSKMLLAMALGLLAIYVPGVIWLSAGGNLFLAGGEFSGYGWANWYQYGIKNFLLIDAIKLLVAVIGFPAIWKLLGETR